MSHVGLACSMPEIYITIAHSTLLAWTWNTVYADTRTHCANNLQKFNQNVWDAEKVRSCAVADLYYLMCCRNCRKES